MLLIKVVNIKQCNVPLCAINKYLISVLKVADKPVQPCSLFCTVFVCRVCCSLISLEFTAESYCFYMNRIMRKPDFCLCENKGVDEISFAVTAKLISAFVFATWIV